MFLRKKTKQETPKNKKREYVHLSSIPKKSNKTSFCICLFTLCAKKKKAVLKFMKLFRANENRQNDEYYSVLSYQIHLPRNEPLVYPK